MTSSHPINYASKRCIVRITARFAPANDCVLIVLLKLVFVAMPSGTVWVDVPSPFVVSGVASTELRLFFICFLKTFKQIVASVILTGRARPGQAVSRVGTKIARFQRETGQNSPEKLRVVESTPKTIAKLRIFLHKSPEEFQ